jgi:hypothetical protein
MWVTWWATSDHGRPLGELIKNDVDRLPRLRAKVGEWRSREKGLWPVSASAFARVSLGQQTGGSIGQSTGKLKKGPVQQKVSIQSRDDVDDGASSKLTDWTCRNTVFARGMFDSQGQGEGRGARMEYSGPHWGMQEREVPDKEEKAGSVMRTK